MPAKQAPKPAAKAAIPSRSRQSVAADEPAEHESTGNENSSKADAFDSATASGLGFTPGDLEARVLEMVYEKNAKGESVKITYEATTTDEDDPNYGKKSSQWYSVFDKDGNAGKGIGFLKQDLEKLGADEEGAKFVNLETTLEEITTAQPLVNVKAKQNGQWLNVYLQGLVEDQG